MVCFFLFFLCVCVFVCVFKIAMICTSAKYNTILLGYHFIDRIYIEIVDYKLIQMNMDQP